MAFDLELSPTFTIDVTVNIPNSKGTFDKNTFKAVFKRPETDELNPLRELPAAELIRQMLTNWDMRSRKTGETIPFNDETFAAFLNIPQAPVPTATAFWEGVNGARSKNS